MRLMIDALTILDEELRRRGLANCSLSMLTLLITVMRHPGESYEFYMDRLGVAKSVFSKRVAKLANDGEGAGLLHRSLMPGSAVLRTLTLTPQGQALANRLTQTLEESRAPTA